MINKKKQKFTSNIIMQNKRAYFEYFIEKEIEAGLSLQGWEVKSLRSYKVNINNSYIQLINNQAYLFNTIITPLKEISLYVEHNPIRVRPLLLNKWEFKFLFNHLNCKGYTIIILSIYWKNIWCKIKIGLAKGKKKYDKRNIIKKREWKKNKLRIIKYN